MTSGHHLHPVISMGRGAAVGKNVVVRHPPVPAPNMMAAPTSDYNEFPGNSLKTTSEGAPIGGSGYAAKNPGAGREMAKFDAGKHPSAARERRPRKPGC